MLPSAIASITLSEPTCAGISSTGFMQHECAQALGDLSLNAHFKPINDNHGPYNIQLSIQNGYLVIELQNTLAEPLQAMALSLRPYRRVIQDYFLMIRSYEDARMTAGPEKLEAIDMGRRGIHNEGAKLFQERLEDKIEMDFETARKFFTLICVLHRTDINLMG